MELEYRHAVVEIQALKGGNEGAINVGAGPVWAARVLPPIIAKFRSQRPKVKIRLVSGVIDTMVPALLSGELDVICSALDFPNHPEIAREQLIELRHVLVVRAEHPLANSANVQPLELLDYPWLALINDYVGTSRVNSFFAANELDPPRISVETTSISTILGLLKEDDFIVNIPTLMLPYAAPFGIRRLPVRGTLWDSPAGIAYRATKSPPPAINAFCALVRSEFADPRHVRQRLAIDAI
jgi:DNA-binding transcriptional LysR family regulator